MIETVVLATDGSQSAKRAVVMALDLAERFDATVHALYVLDSDELDATPEGLRDEVRTALEETGDRALADVESSTSRPIVTAIRRGRPEIVIVDYAREHDADIVAVGTRGRHGEHRLLLGSVAEAVVRSCPVPVLSVRQLDGTDGSAAS